MKIVNIFAEQLYAFHYQGEAENEYDRLIEDWTDVSYLRNYAKQNNIKDVNQFVKDKLKDAEQIEDLLEEIATNNQQLEYYFEPLFSTETGTKILSLQKGKKGRNGLRLYAIKIDNNLFVITGGAIKMSQKMQDHPDSNKELGKIKKAKLLLQDEDVIDNDSFYELIKEIEDVE